jgi:hypothetical protein
MARQPRVPVPTVQLALTITSFRPFSVAQIRVEGTPRDMNLPMKVVFCKDAPPGPAGRAFIAQLKRK